MGDWRTDLITAMGGRATPQTLGFLTGWQRKEGGHTANRARFNWLNRTDKGYPTMNSVGVAVYPDYQTGIARTAALIAQGYPALAGALRSGNISFADASVQGDLNRWLTGKRTPGMSPYVSSVAQLSGLGAGAAPPGGGPQAAAPAPVQRPPARTLQNVMPLIAALQERREARSAGERPEMASLMGAMMALRQQPAQAATAPAQAAPAAPQTSNGFLQAPTTWKGTHTTDNLGWGQGTAEDIMSKPGTAVGAPEDGVIVRHGSAQGGASLYFKGASGRTYWLGHVANSLPPGTRVKRGQVITYISADHPRPHLHIDAR